VSKEFKYIVRLQGTNLDGKKMLPYSLCAIKGLGIRVAHSIIKKLGLDPNSMMGKISDANIKRLDEALEDPAEFGLPKWMLNRRKDLQTGEDLHLLTSELELREKEDVEHMKEIGSWKGKRHARGLKVRGQRTRTTARKGRSVGVKRKIALREEERRRI
jgi:small subunit ribosomal protein S13